MTNYAIAEPGVFRTPANVLVVDDFRTLKFPATTVRTREAAEVALYAQPWDEVWLDHDLEFALTKEQFMKIKDYNIRPLIYKIVADAKRGEILPVGRFYIHSSNGRGRIFMQEMLSRYYPVTMVDCWDWTAHETFPNWAHMENWGSDDGE